MRVSASDFVKLVNERVSTENCKTINNLCEKLQDVIWRNTIIDAMRNYTDHKLEHSYRVLKRALELTDNAENCNKELKTLSKNEICVLCFSALLHDLCMSAHPKMEMDRNIMKYFEADIKNNINYQDYPKDPSCYTDEQQNEIRKFHAYFAIAKIKMALSEENHNLHNVICCIPKELLEYVYIVIKFHTREPLSKIPTAIEGSIITDIRVPFITLLFRLADELDLGEDRDIEAARRQGMPDKSRAYWELDYRMLVSISKSNYIDIKFCANEVDIREHEDLFNKLVSNHINKNEELLSRLHRYHLVIRYDKYSGLTKIDNRKESLLYEIITEFKKMSHFEKNVIIQDNERIAFLEREGMEGFKLKKDYMGLIMPTIGDTYKLYVYKEFELLKEKDSIKCHILIHNNNNISNIELSKKSLNLKAYIAYKSGGNTFKDFIECDVIDEISSGEEYLQFRLYFYTNQHEQKLKLPIDKGDTVAIFYTYQVYCGHYGNELVRGTSIFTDAELFCEFVYPEKNEKLYDFSFFEREDENKILLDDIKNCTKHCKSSILYEVQNNGSFVRLLDDLFDKNEQNFKQINYKKWISLHKKRNERIYHFVANWNFVPFFTDPDIYLNMERYINDGSPSGFTQINRTTKEYSPFTENSGFKLHGFLVKDKNVECTDYGTMPDWLNKNEILIHPDYERCFNSCKKCSEYMVIPTASSRTLYNEENKCYIKLQYNKMLGRLKRTFSPEKMHSAIKISAILKDKFDSGTMPEDIFFMPETFGRIIDFGENFDSCFETRYWGMIIRDFLPYPLSNGKNEERRLIPAFSLFAKKQGDIASKSIIELLYDFRKQNEMSEVEFLLKKIIEPAIKLYFEILLKTGFHIEAHAQNILYLLSIEGNTIDVKGAVIRDFESFDKDLEIMNRWGITSEFETISEKINNSSDSEQYMMRNSFLFDFKFGEYFLSPILDQIKKVFSEIDVDKMIVKIKETNKSYINQLPNNFFPKDKWFSYDNVEFDRTTRERPWITHNSPPKYRE